MSVDELHADIMKNVDAENRLRGQPMAMPSFETTYQSMIDGTWAKKWQDWQKPGLPKHRVDHTQDQIFCTCGAGSFENMFEWSEHAQNFTTNNG